MFVNTTKPDNETKLICPTDKVELQYDMWGALASAYSGGNYYGLFCPLCEYKI